jgi:NADH-quinone oxidoreductase subunit A
LVEHLTFNQVVAGSIPAALTTCTGPPPARLKLLPLPLYHPRLTGEPPLPQNYIPIFLFLVIALAIPVVTLLIAKAVRPENPHETKLMPYECGVDPGDRIRGRYTIRYYIVALLFVIFDVEVIFLFPWAVQFKLLGLFGLLEMTIFLGILIVGYIWIWRKGALEWV